MERFILSAILLAVAACSTDGESREDPGSQPTTREAPTQLIRPVQAGPEPTVPSAAPARAIPPGSLLTFEVQEEVSTASHDAGDSFSLVLVRAVSGSGGALLPDGTPARGVVTEAHISSGPDDPSRLRVRVASIEAGGSQRPVGGQLESTVVERSARAGAAGAWRATAISSGPAPGGTIDRVLRKNTRISIRLQRALVF
jgi:hypothetical protein